MRVMAENSAVAVEIGSETCWSGLGAPQPGQGAGSYARTEWWDMRSSHKRSRSADGDTCSPSNAGMDFC